LPSMEGWNYDRTLSEAFDTPPMPVTLEEALEKVRELYRSDQGSSSRYKKAIENLRELSPSKAANEQSMADQVRYEKELALLRKAFEEKRK